MSEPVRAYFAYVVLTSSRQKKVPWTIRKSLAEPVKAARSPTRKCNFVTRVCIRVQQWPHVIVSSKGLMGTRNSCRAAAYGMRFSVISICKMAGVSAVLWPRSILVRLEAKPCTVSTLSVSHTAGSLLFGQCMKVLRGYLIAAITAISFGFSDLYPF